LHAFIHPGHFSLVLHHLGSGDGAYSITPNKYVTGRTCSVSERQRYWLCVLALDVLLEFLSEMSTGFWNATQEDVEQFNPVQAPRIWWTRFSVQKREVEKEETATPHL